MAMPPAIRCPDQRFGAQILSARSNRVPGFADAFQGGEAAPDLMLEGAPADPSPTKASSRSHVAVDEAIASDDFASGAGDELLVHRSVPDEGVELTVLAAWVHVVGEVGEEG
jgi:hypothetical protein